MNDNALIYHEETKHHFNRFARSMGYLDWETQPYPFRYYEGCETIQLHFDDPSDSIDYDSIFQSNSLPSKPLNAKTISSFFRYSLGVSAWKQNDNDRWALRVNPSSGNLHPTEGYAILGPVSGLNDCPGIYHYVSENHILETRCLLPTNVWQLLNEYYPEDSFLVALSSIVWREAWKYGERAFRYCLHDTGHALAAMRISAALHGWKLEVLSHWTTENIASLLGLDRDEDFSDKDKEEPELIALVYPAQTQMVYLEEPTNEIVETIRSSKWFGRANQLSPEVVEWPTIEKVANATKNNGHSSLPKMKSSKTEPPKRKGKNREVKAKEIILKRRSAVAFNPSGSISLQSFIDILFRTCSGPWCPWDALNQPAFVHLAVFVHRVKGIPHGLYMLVRDEDKLESLRQATHHDFLWERPIKIPEGLPLYLLKTGNCQDIAAGLSCRQSIAGDSFFSLGMITEFAEPLRRYGNYFYRILFWEAGIIGQVLYLEAEAAGARGTGIGCYFDDPVHQFLGLEDNQFQSLYHFTVGVPIEDPRLSTLPAYFNE